MSEKIRDSFIFYRSFYQSAKKLSKEDKAEIFDAICSYALDGEEIDLSVVPEAIFTVIKPNLDANRRRWENGCKDKKRPSEVEAESEQEISKDEANDKQTLSRVEGNKDKDKDVNENKDENKEVPSILAKPFTDFEKFEKIYRQFHAGKKIQVIPFDKLKTKFQKCLKTISYEALEIKITEYLDYLEVATWRQKKDFAAWINDPASYANDWEADKAMELKKPQPNSSQKPKSSFGSQLDHL